MLRPIHLGVSEIKIRITVINGKNYILTNKLIINIQYI